MMNKTIGQFFFLSLVFVLHACDKQEKSISNLGTAKAAETVTTPEETPLITSQHVMKRGTTAYDAIRSTGLPPKTVYELLTIAKDVSPLDSLKTGTVFKAMWSDEGRTDLKKIVVEKSPTDDLVFETNGLNWYATTVTHPQSVEVVTYTNTVESNLWDSASEVGMDHVLISQLAEIFAWQVDFNREVRSGDRWRIVVEKKVAKGRQIGWGNILAAEYENLGEVFQAIRFPQEGSPASYYEVDGSSMRKMFLKSPMRFGRITSTFTGKRFHPVLKHYRPHNGVDYAAPVGTPIMAVGGGKIVELGYNGAQGKMITLRHNSVYKTSYFHMNGFAKGLRKGSKVEQGQIIGYVGNTGLTTGPHLHFAFFEGGVYVDPLGMKFPSADPVDEKDMEDFRKIAATVLAMLPNWKVANNEHRVPLVLAPN
jgi:murein DD-endopeptidase MepM/ murein hydrolase activator NlpD